MANQSEADLENIKRRLDMLDRRLDDIDSAVSVVVERVMSQAVTLSLTCPKCGKHIEVGITGKHRLTA